MTFHILTLADRLKRNTIKSLAHHWQQNEYVCVFSDVHNHFNFFSKLFIALHDHGIFPLTISILHRAQNRTNEYSNHELVYFIGLAFDCATTQIVAIATICSLTLSLFYSQYLIHNNHKLNLALCIFALKSFTLDCAVYISELAKNSHSLVQYFLKALDTGASVRTDNEHTHTMHNDSFCFPYEFVQRNCLSL